MGIVAIVLMSVAVGFSVGGAFCYAIGYAIGKAAGEDGMLEEIVGEEEWT